jgi:hypothetical protein
MLVHVAHFPVTGIQAGKTNVTATPSVLDSDRETLQVLIKASPDNAIPVYLGPYNVTTELGAHPGFRIDPGDSLTLEVVNLAVIHLVADSTGASVFWIAK